ncbi:hypothetical protein [Deinococcus humi]|uniref:8-oxo-dGTP pyrophosphatase MutT (NUDIX family) n=1 Tax=Deinococcus humi TaxID=662880 RepID=A0A7W8JVW9_9DEIO|nr:hypothetical protein [Deinococcus humi]MBB5364212.1 8-oxo-dGTP pyrophosphatase MutT (NUDIX family) [Deinococcus humi]GGO35561.1 hypothetical protein GCM10008949_38240 [Deinococcus humi]
MPSSEWLRHRNALWQRLRELSAGDGVPDTPEFESALRELAEKIGWDRQRVLAGLGLKAAPDPKERP